MEIDMKHIFSLLMVMIAHVQLPSIALADSQEREYVTDEWATTRAFSPAVITQGGKTVWLAGVTTTIDADGNPIGNDFEAQAYAVFAILDERLKAVGGSLDDIVTMTVYIKDPRHGTSLVEIRKKHFDDYPSSALITVSGFARPDIMLEIKAIAVIDE